MAMMACKFCGQTVETPENAEAEYAELHCSCQQAKRYQLTKEQLSRAEVSIEMIFGSGTEKVTSYGQKAISEQQRSILREACVLLTSNLCDAVQIRFGNICTAKVKISGDGKISITRTESRSVTEQI